jgi:hypothetical protein
MSGAKFAKQTSPLSVRTYKYVGLRPQALTKHIFRFHRISSNSLQSWLGSVLITGAKAGGKGDLYRSCNENVAFYTPGSIVMIEPGYIITDRTRFNLFTDRTGFDVKDWILPTQPLAHHHHHELLYKHVGPYNRHILIEQGQSFNHFSI